VGLELTTASVDQEIFFDFIRGSVIPNMMSFNGTNARSIAIMDNLSVHHVREVLDLFQQAGILVMFLPPYSPDVNPIEEAFSCIKSYLRNTMNCFGLSLIHKTSSDQPSTPLLLSTASLGSTTVDTTLVNNNKQ